MAIYDDDTENGDGGKGARGRDDDWEVEDDGPDDRDLVPDEQVTVRCTACRKWIFEDTVRCPYCKQMQLEFEKEKKPVWFMATVVICVGAMGGFGLMKLVGLWPW